MSIHSMSMEMKQRQPDSLVPPINGRPVKGIETISFNKKWFLAKTSDGSRYWLHPESGKVLVIVEK